jgi:hypothetical protein
LSIHILQLFGKRLLPNFVSFLPDLFASVKCINRRVVTIHIYSSTVLYAEIILQGHYPYLNEPLQETIIPRNTRGTGLILNLREERE